MAQGSQGMVLQADMATNVDGPLVVPSKDTKELMIRLCCLTLGLACGGRLLQTYHDLVGGQCILQALCFGIC